MGKTNFWETRERLSTLNSLDSWGKEGRENAGCACHLESPSPVGCLANT